jgi:hypothetical protein
MVASGSHGEAVKVTLLTAGGKLAKYAVREAVKAGARPAGFTVSDARSAFGTTEAARFRSNGDSSASLLVMLREAVNVPRVFPSKEMTMTDDSPGARVAAGLVVIWNFAASVPPTTAAIPVSGSLPLLRSVSERVTVVSCLTLPQFTGAD